MYNVLCLTTTTPIKIMYLFVYRCVFVHKIRYDTPPSNGEYIFLNKQNSHSLPNSNYLGQSSHTIE